VHLKGNLMYSEDENIEETTAAPAYIPEGKQKIGRK
jgi:hypothetical protein